MKKEKNKSPSFSMQISWVIDKVVWTVLSDGKAFAEAEISNMVCIFSFSSNLKSCEQLNYHKFTSLHIAHCFLLIKMPLRVKSLIKYQTF